LFLVLGDHFIGIPSSTWRETFRGDISRRSSLGKVLPIGVMLSATWLISWIIYLTLKQRESNIRRWYILFCLLLWGIAITLLFQHSPKYGVHKLWSVVLDIKTYTSFIVIMLCLQQFFLQFQYSNK
jgi:hypothetical protein